MYNMEHYAIPVLFVLFFLYRRARRTIGFQPYRPRKMYLRMGIFTILGVALLSAGFTHPILFAADAAGLVCGALLATLAIRHLNIEQRGAEWYYRTHIGIETAVLALFVGRIAFRIIVLSSVAQAVETNPANFNPVMKDPWTSGIFFLLISYYVGYYFFVLRAVKNRLSGRHEM